MTLYKTVVQKILKQILYFGLNSCFAILALVGIM